MGKDTFSKDGRILEKGLSGVWSWEIERGRARGGITKIKYYENAIRKPTTL